jgi:ribosomal protein S18 acetylase RimI-like enzyme
MKVKRYRDPVEFAGRVLPFLLGEEAVNNWAVGFLSDVVGGIRKPVVEKLLLCAVEEDDGRVIGTGVSTGESLVLSRMEREGIHALIEFLEIEKVELPGASGLREIVRAFANEWGERRGVGVKIRLQMELMRLERVNPPTGVPGELRLAGMGEFSVGSQWAEGFCRELGMATEGIRASVRQRIERKRLFVWCDPEPVSMAALAGPTPNGVRVNLVYTPPENRRRGYARACVAGLSQKMLDEGKKFVFLYVETANATTNRLYREIGYESLCEWEDWKFGQSG